MSPKLVPMAMQTEGWLVRQVLPFEVGTATVLGGSAGAAPPSAMDGLTGPCPVPKILMVPPRRAGFDALFRLPSKF